MGNRQKRSQTHAPFQSAGLMFLLVLTILIVHATGEVKAREKITVGEVEDVILMPWGVRLPARIDTGAAKSSLDARELKVMNNMAEFKLPQKYGSLQLRLPVVEWQNIRSADFKERRPVVEMTLCLGQELIHTRVTLNDRSTVRYPLIIGRNALKENFVVDCTRSHCLPPNCQEAPSQ